MSTPDGEAKGSMILFANAVITENNATVVQLDEMFAGRNRGLYDTLTAWVTANLSHAEMGILIGTATGRDSLSKAGIDKLQNHHDSGPEVLVKDSALALALLMYGILTEVVKEGVAASITKSLALRRKIEALGPIDRTALRDLVKSLGASDGEVERVFAAMDADNRLLEATSGGSDGGATARAADAG